MMFHEGNSAARLGVLSTKECCRGLPVFDYRLYTLNKNGKVSGPPRILTCDHDEAALKEARKYVDGHDIEIWRDNKRVGLISSKD